MQLARTLVCARWRRALVLSCLAALACSAPAAETPQADAAGRALAAAAAPGAPDGLRGELLRGEWDAALKTLAALEREQPQWEDWWRYLRGRTLSLAERHAEAVAVFEAVEAREPESAWRTKARFSRADALRALGRWAQAEEIYEAEAQRLLSQKRQEELALVYFELADGLSAPASGAAPDSSKANLPRALALYRKAAELDVGPHLRERAQWRAALCLRELGRWVELIALVQSYREEFDPSHKRSRHAGQHVFELREAEAAALVQTKDVARARRAYEDLSAAVAEVRAEAPTWSSWRAAATEETLLELVELDGRVWLARAATYAAQREEALRAVSVLQRLLEVHPDHALAPRATFDLAERYATLERSEDALLAFQRVLEWPAPAAAARAEALEALRMSALFRKGELLAGAERLGDAEAAFSEYVARFPTGPRWTDAQQRLVDLHHAAGQIARRKGEHELARASWSGFLSRYPLDARAAATQRLIGELFVEQAEALRAAARKEGREAPRADLEVLHRSAVDQWRRVVSKYPGADVASESLLRIGQVLERELGDLEGAVGAYRECSFGASAQAAREALNAMTLPMLELSSERVWRTSAAPRIRAAARNLEQLKVEIFALDLEAYFRKNLSHTSVEQLDLDLIAADKVLELAVEGFERYRRVERDIELPLRGPGVWAVAVSAESLRATTLVISSDLEVLLRNSADEALVFVQDLPAQQAVSGARVLLAGTSADGGPAVFEAQTDGSGIAVRKLEGLSDQRPLSVLVVRDGHVATNAFAPRGRVVVARLDARGVCYTDRPVYRPGDTVNWRAIVRESVDGRLVAQPGAPVELQLSDADNRVVWSGRAELSRFGTAHGELGLDERASLGTYRLRCTTASGAVHAGVFEVQRFQPPKARLAIELARSVWMRGEKLEATVRARWSWDEPIAGSALLVEAPDGRRLELVTDERGEARVELETRDFGAEQALLLKATLLEESLSAQAVAYLAAQEFQLSLALPERAVLAGSSFDVRLRSSGLDGQPVGAKVRLAVLERRPAGGTEEVQARELELGTQTGEASAALALGEGRYRIVATATDRFGNAIEAGGELEVSGESDARRLRFFVDSHDLRVGERVVLKLMNRSEPGLALVSIEGGRLLSHRVVRLTSGLNELELDVAPEHAPVFVVAAATMAERELHADEVEFRAARELAIEITPRTEQPRPGEELELELRALDQLGRPVEAELSLAVIDEALLGIHADPTLSFRELFPPQRERSARFGTSSSCTFRYVGVTRVVAAALLAESERAKELREWNERRNLELSQLGALGYGGAAGEGVVTGSDDFFLGRGERRRAAGDVESQAFSSEVGPADRRPSPLAGERLRAGFAPAPRAQADDAQARAIAERELLAHWSPAVVTDAQGRATVRFTLPDSSKRWRCVARGVDTGLLAGEKASSVTAREDFIALLSMPPELVEGDQPRLVARVHNSTGMTGSAKLTLRVEFNGKSELHTQTLALGEVEALECVFPQLERVAPGVLRAQLEVEAELQGVARPRTRAAALSARPYRPSAKASGRLEVRPYGVEVVDARSGVLRDQAAFSLELDAEREPRGRTLEITLGPGVDGLLVATALGEDSPSRWIALESTAGTANQLLGVCATLDLVSRGARARGPDDARLLARAQALVARLSAAQLEHGDWAWTDGESRPHVESTCAAMVALAAARERGLVVSPVGLDRGRSALQRAFSDASMQADEVKALICWAQAANGGADFGALNRLHRQRAALSPAALAYATLAFSAMDNAPMAGELADELERRTEPFELVDGRRACGFATQGNSVWLPSRVEMTALAALALEGAKPRSERLPEAVAYLLAHRPWREPRARGLALAAVARFQGESQPAAAAARVSVRVAGGAPRSVVLGAEQLGERLVFEIPDSAPPSVAVDLRVEGRGAPHFSVELRGFSRKIESKPGAVRVSDFHFSAAPPRYRGVEIRTGFSVLKDSDGAWVNKADSVEFGAPVRGSFSVGRWRSRESRAEDDDYLVAEIPLPAGARLLAGSVSASGGVTVEPRGGVLLVQLGRVSGGASVSFSLIGASPGAYRTLPAVIRSVYAPGRVDVAALAPELRVLARGERADTSAYRATPDELLHLGQARFEAGEIEAGRELLQRLIDGHEARLRDSELSRAAASLLYANIARKAPRDIVRYFEILKEKDPALYVPFDKVLAVGAAYRELGEFERALTIFRATLEETFGKELRVVDALESEQEFAAAADALARTCREYPDAPTVVASSLTLSDKLLTLAKRGRSDPKLRRKDRDPARLISEAVLELQRFMALHPRDPQAPEAGLNMITAYLALEDYGRAARLGADLAQRFTEPRFADAFLYSSAVARWRLEQEDAAVGMLERIAEVEYADAAGRKSRSPNRELALYILGQIHHARQEYGKAAGYYERVAGAFADAREALDALREKHIALPELTRVRPGEKARLELAHRNVEQAAVLVYPVDLMTLYLREKNLSRVTQVNLSGIAPKVRRSLALGRSEGDRASVHAFELTLDEPGAYLVICRGDERHASGLVLVSKLELDVREDAASGSVRVQVSERDGAGGQGRFVRDVDVRVIGSQNPDFVTGRSDPRGLFAAAGIAGEATVIARHGERSYAFHRGATTLAVARKPGRPAQVEGEARYFDNVLILNDAAQQTRGRNWNEEVQRERLGVQVQQVK